MPDTQLPRPIEPGEIRVGDTIECKSVIEACAITRRMSVARIAGNCAFSPGNYGIYLLDGELILIDRPAPTPAPAVGSRWRDPETGARYTFTDSGCYLLYRRGFGIAGDCIDSQMETWRETIARLTPIPDHGDGCSEWLWDKVSASAYVLTKDGSYSVVQGDGYPLCAPFARYSCIRDCASVEARLIPYSERGQA